MTRRVGPGAPANGNDAHEMSGDTQNPGELMMQPLVTSESAVEIASAQLYEQARRDAFNKLADRDGLLVDAEPDQLGIALVNRYHAVKRAGKI